MQKVGAQMHAEARDWGKFFLFSIDRFLIKGLQGDPANETWRTGFKMHGKKTQDSDLKRRRIKKENVIKNPHPRFLVQRLKLDVPN